MKEKTGYSRVIVIIKKEKFLKLLLFVTIPAGSSNKKTDAGSTRFLQ
jgi:hypothetical protein